MQFVYMWKGLDTMVSESTREEVTVSDGLQLGRTTVDQTEVQTVETEINNLKTQIAQVRRTWHRLAGIDHVQCVCKYTV